MPIYIGIDPGKSGGIGWVGDHIGAEKMPPTEADRVAFFQMLLTKDPLFIVIEDLGRGLPRRKIVREHQCPYCDMKWKETQSEAMQSPVTMLTMGENFGEVKVAPHWMGVRSQAVPAKIWQQFFQLTGKHANQTAKKNKHKARAQAMFPELKVTHATADALLLAVYAKELAKRI